MHQEEKKMKKIKKKKEKESKKLKTITEDNKTECLYWEGTFENQSIEEQSNTYNFFCIDETYVQQKLYYIQDRNRK